MFSSLWITFFFLCKSNLSHAKKIEERKKHKFFHLLVLIFCPLDFRHSAKSTRIKIKVIPIIIQKKCKFYSHLSSVTNTFLILCQKNIFLFNTSQGLSKNFSIFTKLLFFKYFIYRSKRYTCWEVSQGNFNTKLFCWQAATVLNTRQVVFKPLSSLLRKQ